MSFVYNDIANQLERLYDIISRSREYNSSICQGKQKKTKRSQSYSSKSVNRSNSPKKQKQSNSSVRSARPPKLEKNSRLCPWIELDEQIKSFQYQNLPEKRRNRSAKTTPVTPTPIRKSKPIKSHQIYEYSDDSPISDYSQGEYSNDYDFYSSEYQSMSSEQEEFLLNDIQDTLDFYITQHFFHKWENRFFAKASMLIQKELRTIESKTEVKNETIFESSSTESTDDVNHITALDSDEKERLIDIIFNSSE